MTAVPTSTRELLGQVIDLAERSLHRPASVKHDELNSLASGIKAQHEKPSEFRRRTYFASLLVDVLAHHEMARRGSEASLTKWAMIAGTILPCVRDDALAALEDERAQMADRS